MAELFSKLTFIFIIIAIVIVVIGVIALVIFLLYKKKINNNKIREDNIDYRNFNRYDTKTYLEDIDDIREDMVICDSGTRFVAIIRCDGFDFYDAHSIEQEITVDGYKGFVNTIDKPITYRMYGKLDDLEDTLKMYEAAYKKICDNLTNFDNKKNELLKLLEMDNLTLERRNLIENELSIIQCKIKAYEFRKFHKEDEIDYIYQNGQGNSRPMVEQTYVVSWTYDKNAFSVDLTSEEIESRAKNELIALTGSKINALRNAGVSAKRCTTYELIDIFRHHSSPISAENYKLRDILSSSYFEDINYKNNINEIKEAARVEKNEIRQEVFNSALKDAFNLSEGENENIISSGKEN